MDEEERTGLSLIQIGEAAMEATEGVTAGERLSDVGARLIEELRLRGYQIRVIVYDGQ
jgi:hypothetical protein